MAAATRSRSTDEKIGWLRKAADRSAKGLSAARARAVEKFPAVWATRNLWRSTAAAGSVRT